MTKEISKTFWGGNIKKACSLLIEQNITFKVMHYDREKIGRRLIKTATISMIVGSLQPASDEYHINHICNILCA